MVVGVIGLGCERLARWLCNIPIVNLLLPRQELNSLNFFHIPKILRARFQCMTSFTQPSHNSYLGFFFYIFEWHILPACSWTPVLILHLTNPCAKRKVLSLTNPKGKIHKTKSLCHYITIKAGYGQVSHQKFDLQWLIDLSEKDEYEGLQSTKKNSPIQTINQIKWQPKCIFLPYIRSQKHFHFSQVTLIKTIHCKNHVTW